MDEHVELLQGMMYPVEPAILPNATRAEYDAISALNCSLLKPGIDIEGKSYELDAREILYELSHERSRTQAQRDQLDFGVALHMALLERHRFETQVVHYGKVRNSNEWKDFQRMHRGKVILQTKKYDEIGRILTAVLKLPEWGILSEWLAQSDPECCVTVTEDGIGKKGLLDVVSRPARKIIDLKTTALKSMEKFHRNIYWALGAFISLGSYLHWYNMAAGRRVIDECVIVTLVVTPPYDLHIRPCDPQDMERGSETQRKAAKDLKRVLESGDIRGKAQGEPMPLVLHDWMYPETEEMGTFEG